MAPPYSPFLLLQARDAGDPMLDQELGCFARRLGVSEGDIATHNLVLGPPPTDAAQRSRAVLVGGSGDYLVSRRDLPRFAESLEAFRNLVEKGHPVFASCFGFQCMVEALGGSIVYDPENTEVGTVEVALTEEGAGDSLLGRLPARFWAQVGHKDRAAALPEGASHLASSELCPYQAFVVDGKPVWATQFHPELTARENHDRYQRYMDNYRGTAADPGDAAGPDGEDEAVFRESRETEVLLPEFVRRFVDV